MRLSDFSALTFDCYGTLIDWESGIRAALRGWRARAKISDDALLAAYHRAEAGRELAKPTLPYPEILGLVLRDLAAEFGAPVSDEEAEAFADSIKDWPAFDDSAAALAYFKQQHYKLIIISNVDHASFRHSNAKLNVGFDAIITAEDAGTYKPALNHFHLAFERLAEMGIGKQSLLHVAQSLYHDHAPAKRLGLATVWVNRRGERDTASGRVKPDWEVPNLAALVDLHRREIGQARP